MSASSESLLHDCIEKIETGYEFMLAYAAQGRKAEPVQEEGNDSPSIRTFLEELNWGIENIAEGFSQATQNLAGNESIKLQLEKFKLRLAEDAQSAAAITTMVLGTPTLSSQLIDNLNASTHLRTLLTDIFVLDEVLNLHQR